MNAIVPIPRTPITIRLATAGDYSFIDRLQDMHSKALGFMPKAQLEGKIAAGHVLIAEEKRATDYTDDTDGKNLSVKSVSSVANLSLGYCMSQDRYFKRDDVGIVYQLNVSPGAQRKLVGAMLLKAVFERAAYGCKLFCCWCAQDLDANYFWESMGFLPLAFRTGASGKRTHIFWERRIREGDTTTPYWFPAKTDGGHIREDRLVLPIPPGVHWKDAMPVLLPEVARAPRPCSKELISTGEGSRTAGGGPVPRLRQPTTRRVQFGPPSDAPEPVVEKVKLGAKKTREKKPKVKADPAHVAKARELRDRYLEQFNAGVLADGNRVLPQGKYQVSRTLSDVEGSRAIEASPVAKPMLFEQAA